MRYEIVCLAKKTFPMFGQSWLLTVDPLIGKSVVFAELSKLEWLHGYELIQVMYDHFCLLMSVHFSVCSQHYGWCSGPFYCP